jgi:outer membrane protein OmpA-like peptidoglycan-associated protein
MSEIPPRYKLLKKEETQSLSYEQLRNNNALETYYYVLNIIGKRLQENPSINITLTGTNSNTGIEKNNKELSQARAQSVVNYFQNLWNIAPERVKIESRNLPKEPSRNDEPQGIAENRRVEIYSDDPSITEPVFTVDTMRVISASSIKFIPKVLTEVGVNSWDLNIAQGNQTVLNKKGEGYPPESIDWEISQRTVPKGNEDLAYSIKGMDSVGQTATSKTKRIPISKKSIEMKRHSGQSDTEYEYYSLILFDFGQYNLNKEHRKVVDFVKSRVTNDSKVSILGFTDNIGEEDVNKKISEKRAKSVAKRLNINHNAIVEGKGESELIYDNSTPEGRFYCRTVNINIETPIKQ